MEKKYFVLHLIPSRPDFAETMTDEERKIMLEHAGFWKNYMDRGIVLVVGPVFDPKGTYGLGIVAVDDEAQVNELIKNDPASKINRYEYFPMKAMVKDEAKN